MEEDHERMFVCKYCDKSFVSGKSLGGHMRGHLPLISAERLEGHNDGGWGSEEGGGYTGYGLRENPKKVRRVSDSNNRPLKQEKLKSREMGFDGVSNDGYGLRENPKKSWRVSDSKKGSAKEENICKKCGKIFTGLRALSGHLRTHSMQERKQSVCKTCGKGFGSMRALFGHMRSHSKKPPKVCNEQPKESHSDTETQCPTRRKRSRTKMRCNIAVDCSFCNMNASSSVSQVKEVEDVAMCLMMLSRGEWDCSGFDLVTESSDNNSLCFEAQSMHPSKGMAESDGGKSVCDGHSAWKINSPAEKLDSSVSGSGNSLFEKIASESGDSPCGSASNDELDVSVDGFLTGEESMKIKQDDEFGIASCDSEIEEGFEAAEVELENNLLKEVGLDQAESEIIKPNSSEEVILNVDDPKLELGRGNLTVDDTVISRGCQSQPEYKCKTCKKIFHSYRALGGHRASHRIGNTRSLLKEVRCENRVKKDSLSDIETNLKLDKMECNENGVEEELGSSSELKKGKDYECLICYKVFASGQALGGHKRAHYVAFSESRAKEAMVVKQELLSFQNFFDLNLPVSHESEASCDVGLNLWWVGSNHQGHEPLVIPNSRCRFHP